MGHCYVHFAFVFTLMEVAKYIQLQARPLLSGRGATIEKRAMIRKVISMTSKPIDARFIIKC